MSPKVQIQQLRGVISGMQRQRLQMIEAFQKAFGAAQGKIDAIIKAIHILGDGNPEILKLLPLQPEEGSDEADSGDAKPGVLPLPSAAVDSGSEGDAESGETKASGEAPSIGSVD